MDVEVEWSGVGWGGVQSSPAASTHARTQRDEMNVNCIVEARRFVGRGVRVGEVILRDERCMRGATSVRGMSDVCTSQGYVRFVPGGGVWATNYATGRKGRFEEGSPHCDAGQV